MSVSFREVVDCLCIVYYLFVQQGEGGGGVGEMDVRDYNNVITMYFTIKHHCKR